jgi:hypothetical protein
LSTTALALMDLNVSGASCIGSNSRFERDFVKLSQNQNLRPLFVPREQTVVS